MNEIQKMALERGLKFIAAAGATFAVVDSDGIKYGTLELAPPPPVKAPKVMLVKRGYYKDMLEPLLRALPPGQSIDIPLPEGDGVTLDSLQSCASGIAGRLFGVDSYLTHRLVIAGKPVVQVLRA